MSESGAALAEVQRLRSTLHSLTSSAAPALPVVDGHQAVVWGQDGEGGAADAGSFDSASSEMAGSACDGASLLAGGSWATSAAHPAGSAEHLSGVFETPAIMTSITLRSWHEAKSELRVVVLPVGSESTWTVATAWAAYSMETTVAQSLSGVPLTALGPIERFRLEARHTRAAASSKEEPPRQRLGCKRLMIRGALASARAVALAKEAHRIDPDIVPAAASRVQVRTVAQGESKPKALVSASVVDYTATHAEAHGVFFTVRAKKRGPFAIKVRAILAASKHGPAESTVWVHDEVRDATRFDGMTERDERMRDIAGWRCVASGVYQQDDGTRALFETIQRAKIALEPVPPQITGVAATTTRIALATPVVIPAGGAATFFVHATKALLHARCFELLVEHGGATTTASTSDSSVEIIPRGSTRSAIPFDAFGRDPMPCALAGGVEYSVCCTDEVAPHYRGGKILNDRYIISTETLARGRFSTIKKAALLADSSELAVKIIQRSSRTSDYTAEKMKREMKIAKALSHPNVVRCHDILVSKSSLYIVQELCTGGDLAQLLRFRHSETRQRRPLRERDTRTYALQICAGLAHCHEMKVSHRDLRPGNILIAADGTLKIADFGQSNLLESEYGTGYFNSVVGTPEFAPPEQWVAATVARGDGGAKSGGGGEGAATPMALDDGESGGAMKRVTSEMYEGHKADMWALGCLLYTMLMAKTPFEDYVAGEQFVKRAVGEYSPIPLRRSITESVSDLIAQLIVADPDERFRLDSVRAHPWLVHGAEGGDYMRFKDDRFFRKPRGEDENAWGVPRGADVLEAGSPRHRRRGIVQMDVFDSEVYAIGKFKMKAPE